MAGHFEIRGKTVLITGGASGLGALYAEAFLKEGAKNVAIVDVAEATGKETAERLNKTYPGKVIFMKCDVGSEDEVNDVFQKIVIEFSTVDIIINNAGIMVDSPNLWRKACDVNWQGLVSFTMKGWQHMRKDQGGAGGTIINISSTAALTRFPFLPIYCGSKLAVLHFSQCFAMNPQDQGVRILTICFGPTDTPLLQDLASRSYDKNLGIVLEENTQKMGMVFQKPTSAVEAFLQMFREGQNGTIWLSVWDKPVKDITPIISNMFEQLEQLVLYSNFTSG